MLIAEQKLVSGVYDVADFFRGAIADFFRAESARGLRAQQER
jgi:hypothetical protein